MGLDWRTLDLSSYFETADAHSNAHDPDAATKEPAHAAESLSRFMKAHGDGGNRERGKAIATPQGAPRA